MVAANPYHLPPKLRGFVIDRNSGQPVPGVVVVVDLQPDDDIHIPLGMLVSDNAGYVSFDFANFTNLNLRAVQHLWLDALGDEAARRDIANRILPIESAFHFILQVDSKRIDRHSHNVRLPSIQNPDEYDWEISPYSFAAKPELSLGEGGCEVPHPSTIVAKEFRFARVVLAVSDADREPIAPVDPLIGVGGEASDAEMQIQFANVYEFVQSWYPRSHSLGQIVYSLPLAPCESVNLAVIDWSRRDTVIRTDSVQVREDLAHEQRRDRTIEESIGGAIKEAQNGWSLMGGMSHADSAGASATIPIYGIPVDINAAASNVHSLGGSIAHSSGERNVTASSLQEIHDLVKQQTSVVRSLNSTVIIQATQEEANVVQTRTVTNHNHCHALTVQYYEVLRNFKIVTTFERRRKAVLIPYRFITNFTWEIALHFRTLLTQVLLQPELEVCFDPIVRIHYCTDRYKLPAGKNDTDTIPAPPASPPPPEPQRFGPFTVERDAVDTQVYITQGSEVQLIANGFMKFAPDLGPGSLADGNPNEATNNNFPAPLLTKHSLICKIGNQWHQGGVTRSFVPQESGILMLQANDDNITDNAQSWDVVIYVKKPTQAPVNNVQPTRSQINDQCCEQHLLDHLNGNLGYYNRAIWFLQDPVERRIALENSSMPAEILNALDEMPIAVSGNYVAFPYNIEIEEEIEIPRFTAEELAELAETLGVEGEALADALNRMRPQIQSRVDYVTLPTRGLFAEAQLGHCNSCEVRDVTRFWDWNESPCEPAPIITGIAPGPQGEPPIINPISLPSPVVQISQPLAAPDPLGLAAVLQLLGTPNIFRDMSGLAEVSKLLDALTSGAVTLTEAQVMAQQAKSKLKGATSGGGGSSGGKSLPSESNPSKQVDKLNAIKYAKEQGLIDDNQASDAATGVLGGVQLASADSPPSQLRFQLTNSVGQGGINLSDDVYALKSRLIELGFNWLILNRVMDGDTIQAIRLFQAIKNGHHRIAGHPENDGLVEVGQNTYRWLQAWNAPRWQLMPVGSWDEGFVNVERLDAGDQHDFGTNWMAATIEGAGADYKRDYLTNRPQAGTTPALLTINDVSLPRGGNTPDHAGHETGLDCDLRLPRDDGTAPGNTTYLHNTYDQDAMRAMLTAFGAQPLVSLIYFNDPVLIGENLCTQQADHDDHVHVEINPPPMLGSELVNPGGVA